VARSRALVALAALAAVLAGAGCAPVTLAEKRAFFEAGRELQRKQPPPTEAELKRDLDLFLENDLLFTFDKAKAREAKEVSTLRIVFVGGMALAVVGGTAGSLKGNPGAQTALIGTGVAAMAGSAIRYFTTTKSLHECQEFLASKAGELHNWERRKLSGPDGPVLPETWREYVDLVSEIRLHESCLAVR
jgi:hypothetical protein